MITALQSSVDGSTISALGAVLGLGGLALTWLWLRALYRSSGT